jgi:hypothetical protein
MPHASDSARSDDRADVTLTPARPAYGWIARWDRLEPALLALRLPRPEPINGAAISEARRDLDYLLIDAYHLKDFLKVDTAATGVSRNTVEDQISITPALALLADACNLLKHGSLKSTRSGSAPVFGSPSGTSIGMRQGTWRLEQPITHQGKKLDGIQVASDAIDAWRGALQHWRLIPV